MSDTAEWDMQLRRLEDHARTIVIHKPDAVLGVVVNDLEHRDYFVPRLRAILEYEWARQLTFKVGPIDGEPVVLMAEDFQAPQA